MPVSYRHAVYVTYIKELHCFDDPPSVAVDIIVYHKSGIMHLAVANVFLS